MPAHMRRRWVELRRHRAARAGRDAAAGPSGQSSNTRERATDGRRHAAEEIGGYVDLGLTTVGRSPPTTFTADKRPVIAANTREGTPRWSRSHVAPVCSVSSCARAIDMRDDLRQLFGCGYGRARSSARSITVKIAVVIPIHGGSVGVVVSVNTGLSRRGRSTENSRIRRAYVAASSSSADRLVVVVSPQHSTHPTSNKPRAYSIAVLGTVAPHVST